MIILKRHYKRFEKLTQTKKVFIVGRYKQFSTQSLEAEGQLE